MDTFVEKFEVLEFFSRHKLQNDNLKNDGNKLEEGFSSSAKAARLSIKQQVVSIMQKIFIHMQERRFNKKQIFAVFDKNSNGILNREEFLEGVKSLGIGIPYDKCKILIEYIDKNNNGLIEIDEFVSMLYESLPQSKNLKKEF